MKTIRRFFNTAEAGFARSVLESAGIPAVLADEYAYTLGPQYVPWGIRLQVHESDVERALEIIAQQERFSPLPDDFIPPFIPVEDSTAATIRRMSQGKQPIPPALNIVALLFFLYGITSILGMVVRWVSGSVFIDFGVLCVPAFFGLRRFSAGWRTFALFCIWTGLLVLPIVFGCGLFTSTPGTFSVFGRDVGKVPAIWVSVVSVPIFLLQWWQYRVLTRPEIRALFLPEYIRNPVFDPANQTRSAEYGENGKDTL